MHQTRYLVGYVDRKGASAKYFGPFVSIRIAEDFMASLPEPQYGGGKALKPIAPYNSDEASIASAVIMRERDKRDPHSVAISRARAPQFADFAHSR